MTLLFGVFRSNLPLQHLISASARRDGYSFAFCHIPCRKSVDESVACSHYTAVPECVTVHENCTARVETTAVDEANQNLLDKLVEDYPRLTIGKC